MSEKAGEFFYEKYNLKIVRKAWSYILMRYSCKHFCYLFGINPYCEGNNIFYSGLHSNHFQMTMFLYCLYILYLLLKTC